MLDFKTGAILFVIILLAVYSANMWGYKMIKAEEEREAYRKSLLPPAPTPTTTT